MVNKKLKRTSLVLVIVFVVLMTLTPIYFLAENVFFDTVFYKKSKFHGYVSENFEWNLQAFIEDWFLSKRVTSLKELYSSNIDSTSLLSKENTFKIFVIGDSYSYGTGVLYQETYPVRLQKLLDKKYPKKFTVINISIIGDEIVDTASKLQQMREQKIKHGILIVPFLPNDVLLENKKKYPNKNEVYDRLAENCKDEEDFYVWGDIHTVDWDEFTTQEIYPRFFEYSNNNCIAEEVVKHYLADNSAYVFFYFSKIKNEKEIAIYNEFKRMLNMYEVNYLESDNTLDFKRVSKLEGHPSKESHMIYAELLLDFIEGTPEFKFFYP